MISGPHPIGQMIAWQCVALGVAVALIVRQNLMDQMRAHRGLKRVAAMTAAMLLERDFRRLARGRTVFTVGRELTAQYRHYSERVHEHFPCLITNEQFRAFSSISRDFDPRRLLFIGRLSPEKGIGFLLEAVALLRRRGLVCSLDIAGTGPLEQELKDKVGALGLTAQVKFHGYVPFGPALFELYERAGLFVLPSLTEGFPQVINEALCAGLPTIASPVGGIPAFLSDGETALLAPPGDIPALAASIERMIGDRGLCERLRRNGRALMAENTLEANRSRVLTALHNEVFSRPYRATDDHRTPV
jgi:glycosyltransferase involved in cell wall biosynthesis